MATFTNKIKVTNFQIKSTEPLYSNQSWTGQKITRSTGIQYYQIQFQLNCNIKDRGEVLNFLAQYSQGKPFTFSLGHFSSYQGNQNGNLTSQTQVPKGSIIINTNSNSMAVGELIQFSNHNKIYRVIDCTDTSLTVFPALQNVVQAGETIIYDNLMIEAVLDNDNDYSLPVESIVTLQLKATENIV